MGLKFLQDIINLDSIQFVNSSGTNAGLINMDGNDLVISNSQGDVLLGDGSADVFIGDGTNNVDIRFEQSGSITADNASATLTIGGTGNLVVEEPTINNPTFSGAFNLGSKLTLSTSNGYILFDYEPAGDTGEYTTEVPLLKVDHNGVEKTILSRISENGGIQLGHDDSVLITAGDVGDEIKSNWGATNENVVIASEAGFTSYAFPNNSTTWSNRNEFRFYGGDATAANNGLYIGDGSNTQFIDLDRNISAASVTAGNIKAMGGGNLFVYDDDDDTKIHFFASSNSNEGFLQLSNGSNWGLLARGKGNDPRLGAYHGGYLSIWGFGSNTGDDHVDDDELARFDFANERLIVNGEISTGGNITTSSNSYIVSSRKFTARDANGTGLFADDAASGLSIADDGDATFTGDLTVNGVNYGAYHSVNEDQYYFDDYNGRRNLAFFYKNARADIIRYQPVDNFEYWNGSAWVADSSQESNVKKLLDGRQDTSWNVPSTYYKFRFTTQTTTSWPTMAMIWMQTSWSGSTWPGATMLVEEYDGSSWATIVTAEFTSANGVTHWGLSSKADSALHTGNGQNADTTRITVDFYGWTPSNGSYTTIPLQNLMITSNYAGTENTDYTNLLSHDKHLRLGDNRMFAFGDGDDLQIYHDGSNSIIDDAGTGNLKIRSNRLQLEKYTGETMAEFIADGSSSLYYDNNKKLETTSTGVDVTGDVTASGYYYADTHFQSTDSNATLSATGGGSVYLRPNGAFSTTGQLVVHDTTGNVDISGNLTINSTYPRIFLTDSNHNDDWSIINNDGKFGIYNDTDTSYALAIDGSNNVGIGTTSPTAKLQLDGGGSLDGEIRINSSNATSFGLFRIINDGGGSGKYLIGYGSSHSSQADELTLKNTEGDLTFHTGTSGANEQMRIDTSGNVGIGTATPSEKLDVAGNIAVSGTVDGVDIAARDAVLTSTTTTANAALPQAGGTMTGQLVVNHNAGTLNLVGTDHTYIQWYPAGTSGGRHAYTGFAGGGTDHFTIANETSGAHINLTTNSGTVNVTGNLGVTGTVDGRDVATDGTKLDTIATNADVTPSWVPSSDPSYLTAHPNISAASSVNNSGKTYIQDITLDSNGHVTGLVSDSLTGSDFIEPGSNATLNSLSCGSYTHDTDIAFVLDSDNNETASFIIKDGVGNSPFTLTEDGDLTITGKFVSTFASKTSPGAILVEDSGEIKKRTTTELKTDLSLNNVPNTDATNASNLASGTVPEARLATTTIAKGGTGATTAAGARTALGAAASSHTHAASDITSGTFDSNRVKQICTTHHNFFMNSTANPPTADFFVPFNNLNESSNPTNAQYYNRMVAPYDGRIVKVVLHTTAAIGTACQVLFWVATSSGTFAPSAAETVTGVDLNTANTSATATFSTTSTAQFSEGDVLGVSIIKSTTATANMQVTLVWEYTL